MQIDFLSTNDELLNNLLVGMNEFADITCLWARAFGVVTDCDDCDINVNFCLRKNIITNLIKAQDLVEKELGWNLTPRYHTEKLVWSDAWLVGKGDKIRFQTQWPGIEAVNVERNYTAVAELTDVALNFIIQAAVPLTPADGENYCIAELDKSVIANPSEVTLMDADGKVFPQQKERGFPRVNEAGNWEVPIYRIDDPETCPDIINAYHCRLVYVDVTPPETCEGTLVPVYPGTQQHIPQAADMEVLDNGDYRYWFNVWELVNPAFKNETVDISAGEYYKLLQTISFLCMTEDEKLPVVVCNKVSNCDCGEDTEYTDRCSLKIIDAVNGIVELCCDEGPCPCGCNTPEFVTIYYKTNPEIMGFDGALYGLMEAVTYWTAAILPLQSCQCVISEGFIATAQKAYTQIRVNPLTGEEIHNLRHGNLYGQLVFSERLGEAPRYVKPIFI